MTARTNDFLVKYSFVPGSLAAVFIGLFYVEPLWIFYAIGSWALAAFFLMFLMFGIFPRYVTWGRNQFNYSLNWPLEDWIVLRKLFYIEDKLKRRDENA